MVKEDENTQSKVTNQQEQPRQPNGDRLAPFGELIKLSWQLTKDRYAKILAITLMPILLFAGQIVADYFAHPIEFGMANIISTVLGIVGTLASLLASIAVIKVLQDEKLSAGAAFSHGAKLFLPALWIGILVWLVTMGGSIPLIIPGIAIGISVVYAQYSLVLENKRGLSAMVRSWNLIRGRWWAVFGRLLGFGLVYWAFPYMAIALLIVFVGSLPGVVTAEITLAQHGLGGLVFLIGLAYVLFYAYPLGNSYSYVLFANMQQSRPSGAYQESPRKRTQYRWIGIWGIVTVVVLLVIITYAARLIFTSSALSISDYDFEDPSFDSSAFEQDLIQQLEQRDFDFNAGF